MAQKVSIVLVDDLDGKLPVVNGCNIFHGRLPVHPFPAPDPFPIAGVALVAAGEQPDGRGSSMT